MIKKMSKFRKLVMMVKIAKKIVKINEKRKKIKSTFKNVYCLQ